MTTCVVVKKDGEVAIAADSLVTFGDTRLARGYEQNQKIFQVGDSLIALAGTTAHFPVMRSLLAGLACQGAAAECREQRRYEASARLLQQGLQLLQRMGQQPEQRRKLEHDLHTLLPYRVLDLISRDLSAVTARQEGIALLDQLVQRRGGLEGDADPDFAAAQHPVNMALRHPFKYLQQIVIDALTGVFLPNLMSGNDIFA